MLNGMQEPRTIFFIGKPGCGKGTQAKMLAAHTGWPVIASGAQFRTIAAEDTPVGRKIRAELNAGMLAPHWFAMYLYQKALFALPEGADVIFDGFNRKVPEAELIISSLTWLSRPFHIVHIAVSDETVTARLAARLKLEHREDDHAVAERLQEYYEYTDKAVALFRNTGVLIEIDGEQPPEDIAKEIFAALHV